MGWTFHVASKALLLAALPKEGDCSAWREEPAFWSRTRWHLCSATYWPCEPRWGSSCSQLWSGSRNPALAGLGHSPDQREGVSGATLVSRGCSDQCPQTRWLLTAGVYSLMVLEARSPKSRCQKGRVVWKGSGEGLSLPFLALRLVGAGNSWRSVAYAVIPAPTFIVLSPVSQCTHLS